MDKPQGRRTCLYSTAQLDSIVSDMARQAAGLLTGRTRVAIVGILRRGAPLADQLHSRLAGDYGLADCVRLDLQIKRYADDLTLLYPETRLTENTAHATPGLEGYTVLVVDDVMYRGHSMLRAVEYLACRGSPRKFVPWCWWTGARRNCRCAPTLSVSAWMWHPRILSNAMCRLTRTVSGLICCSPSRLKPIF